MKVKTLGIDLAKVTFGLHGVGAHGQMVLQKRVTRKQLLGLLAKLNAWRGLRQRITVGEPHGSLTAPGIGSQVKTTAR